MRFIGDPPPPKDDDREKLVVWGALRASLIYRACGESPSGPHIPVPISVMDGILRDFRYWEKERLDAADEGEKGGGDG